MLNLAPINLAEMQSYAATILARTTPPTPDKPILSSQLTTEQTRAALKPNVYWNIAQHRKALAALKAARKARRGVAAAKKIAAAALAAVADAVPSTIREAAIQLETCSVYGAAKFNDPHHLRQFAAKLTAMTEFPCPEKAVAVTQTDRGRITRSGVLLRYHSFLAQELRNVGVELYGSVDYATRFTPFDHYVGVAIGGGNWTATLPKKLPARARKVMAAIGIDTKFSDDETGYAAHRNRKRGPRR